MNARAYFTILRPVRTLVFTGMYGTFIWLWLGSLFRATNPEALFFTLAVIGPVLVGGLLLGPIHEVMHRSLFATLPGARLALRRWHVCAVAVATLLLFIPAAIFVTGIPDVALFGLVIAGMSLPVLNNRRRWRLFRLQYPTLITFGIILAASARSSVVSACQEGPWIVLLVGIGCAYVCFRIGFSQKFVRDRWRDPHFFCFQSMIPFLGTDMILYAQTQQVQLAQNQSPKRGGEWMVRSVGSSLREWVGVVNYARFGQISRFRHLIQLALPGLFMMPIFVGVSYRSGSHGTFKTSLAELCSQLVEAGKSGGHTNHQDLSLAFMLPPFFALGFSLLAATRAMVPATSFPIGRTRLAACTFISAGLSAAGVFLANLLGVVLGMFAASQIAGVHFEAGMLLKPLASFAILPPIIVLGLGTNFLRNAILRYGASAALSFGTIFATVAIVKQFAPFVASPLGLVVGATATFLSVWLSWHAARNYYRTCDLTCAFTWIKKLGIGVT
jgi:hypothetical protein